MARKIHFPGVLLKRTFFHPENPFPRELAQILVSFCFLWISNAAVQKSTQAKVGTQLRKPQTKPNPISGL